MGHISTITSALGLAKNASELSNKLFELGKSLKDRGQKQQLDEIADKLRDLKQAASNLEDENRELREKVRFKSDEYENHAPFRYHKDRPEHPLCVKCFAQGIEAPMGEQGQSCIETHRKCLVCGVAVQVSNISPS